MPALNADYVELYIPEKDSIPPFVMGLSRTDMSEQLIDRLKKATYLGSGASSWVWDIGQGEVLKLTQDQAVIAMSQKLRTEPKAGMVNVSQVHDIHAGISGVLIDKKIKKIKPTLEKWSVIIERKYEPVPDHIWALLEDKVSHVGQSHIQSRPGWARNQNGFPAKANKALEHLTEIKMILDQHQAQKPLGTAMLAIECLSTWWQKEGLFRQYGLDIDRQRNWGWSPDTQELIVFDPVYGNYDNDFNI